MASSGPAACVAPADYGDLFLEFGEDIRRLARRQLGPSGSAEDADDTVSYIMQQFVRNDVLAQYRPGVISSFNHRPVTFKAFIMAKVALYCRGRREALVRHQGRELLLVDIPAGDGGQLSWLDLMGGTADCYPSLSDGDAYGQLREALAGRAPEASGREVLPLFDALAARFDAGEPISAAAVRRQFRLQPGDAEAWFEELKTALREVTSPGRREQPAPEPEPLFELGGMMLTAAEVRAAAGALRAAPGARVLPVLAAAGHRLAAAGKTWYLDFAAAVLREHPELRGARGGHYAGGHAGKVKPALVYGLERLLDGVPGPQAAEPVPVPAQLDEAPWGELEAVLARFPGVSPDAAEAAMEAVRLLVAA